MSKIMSRKGLGTILAIGLIAFLLLAACAPPATLPPGGEAVEVGALPVLTGGGGSADQPHFLGFEDYIRYFNAEEGIPGVTVELVWRDCATDVQRWLSGYHMLADRGVPVLQSNLTLVLGGVGAILEKDQICLLVGSPTDPVVYPPGWMFAGWALESEAATAVFDYFMENWKGERPPRLQLFASETTFGREPEAAMTKYAESVGFEVLPTEFSPLVVIDATTQLIRIRGRGADLVYIQNIFTAGGPIMRDVERLGFQDEMQFGGTSWVLTQQMIDMAPVATDGFLTPRPLPWMDETEIPGVKLIRDIQLEYHGKVQDDPVYMGGWVYGAIVCEAVKRGIEEVGLENLDGATVKKALEDMRDFDVDGIVKITYGPEDRRGCQTYAVYQVQGGKVVRLSDWREVPILVP